MAEAYDDYEGRLCDALRAIVARINGEFDAPELSAFGPLSIDPLQDIKYIAETAIAGNT